MRIWCCWKAFEEAKDGRCNMELIVGFNCKGCMINKEYVKTQAIEDKRVFAGSSRLSIPRNDACVLHVTRMRRVRTDGDSCVLRVAHE